MLKRVIAGLTAATVAVGFSGTVSAARPRQIAVCDHRACLLLLQKADDFDGDGVADIDEAAFGTDPRSVDSAPTAAKLLDALVRRGLPSFDRQLTELVVLPKTTPDGSAIATGLGAFNLEDHDAKLIPDLWTGLEGLRKNSFDPSKGFTTSLPMQKLEIPKDGPLYGPWADAALVSAGTGPGSGVCCATNAGPNRGKDVSEVSGGHTTSDGHHLPEFSYGRDGSATHRYTVSYTDGTRDRVSTYQEADHTTETYLESFDDKGNLVATSYTSSRSSTDDNGVQTTTTDQTTKTYEGGQVTGTTSTTTTTTTGNGATTTTTTTEKYDADGKLISRDVQTTTTNDCTGKVTCGTDDKYQDPDYIATTALTDEDLDRVAVRLNAVRTPGPDSGGAIDGADPTQWHWGDSTPSPLVALIDSDGVVAIAEGHTPTFNHAQPDYDPRLVEIGQISGEGVPTSDGDTTRWP